MNIFPTVEQKTFEQLDNKEKELDPRSRRSRRDLANAFVFLLQEKDFDSITIKDIVEKAMVSRLTFYNQFKDKYELLEYIFKTSVDSMGKNIEKDLEDDKNELSKDEILKITIKNIVHILYSNKELFSKWVENDKSKAIYWCLTNFIKDVLLFVINEYEEKSKILFDNNDSKQIFVHFAAGGFTYTLYEYGFHNVKNEEDIILECYKFIAKRFN